MDTDDFGGDVDRPIIAYPHQELTHAVIGAAMAVHRELGSGFLEKVYENALTIELRSRGVTFESQVTIPVTYKGQAVGTYYADLIVDRSVLCELKALDGLTPIHESQVLHYLKGTGLKVGLLLNFGSSKLQVKRMIL